MKATRMNRFERSTQFSARGRSNRQTKRRGQRDISRDAGATIRELRSPDLGFISAPEASLALNARRSPPAGEHRVGA